MTLPANAWHITATGSPYAVPKSGEAHSPSCPGCVIDRYRTEADIATRDYEALEMAAQRTLELLVESKVGEAFACLNEALHGEGPHAALTAQREAE